MSQKPVVINGREYDPHTGVPLMRDVAPTKKSAPHVSKQLHHATSIHKRTQRAVTLNRRYVTSQLPKKAAPAVEEPAQVAIPVHQRAASPHKITKFAPLTPAPQTIPLEAEPPTRAIDIAPTVHPMAQRVQASRAQNSTASPATVPKPSEILKAEAIQRALDQATPREQTKRQRTPKEVKRRSLFPRVLSFASAGTALLLLGGYFTYLNMPNLSVRVAASQAGIDASYPSYRPSGYSLNGPIAYDNGQVQMKFAANGGPQNFTLTQERSGWDSSAVLDNYVEPKAGDQYVATQDSGLTIYTYENDAAWVSNGILYTISGDAPLSTDQVGRIATSM